MSVFSERNIFFKAGIPNVRLYDDKFSAENINKNLSLDAIREVYF